MHWTFLSKTMFSDYNRRQNQLRHFALNWAFLRSTDFKREKYSFFSPIPPSNVVPLYELPIENNKHPNFEWRGQGRGRLRVGPHFSSGIVERAKRASFSREMISRPLAFRLLYCPEEKWGLFVVYPILSPIVGINLFLGN